MIDLIIVDVMTPQILISSYINAVLKFQVNFPEKGYEVGKYCVDGQRGNLQVCGGR